jgi:RNA polymerase sigma factor (TIGR02999 family)
MDESDRSLSAADLTRLLKAWNRGDAAALEELTPIVYQELHRLARLQMADERPGHMLQPSALVNEAFLRLTRNAPVEWESRRQFFAVSARLMRQVLIDFARAQGTRKRGERVQHLDVADLRDAVLPASGGLDPVDLVDLDEALDRLASLDGRQAQVVELRFFGGMENGEIAAVLGISEPTVIRDWRLARAWLYDTLQHRP